MTAVIVVNNLECLDQGGNESEEVGIAFCKSIYGQNTTWLQTSYNGNIRGKYAGLGDTYDPVNDFFVSAPPDLTPIPEPEPDPAP